MKEAKSEFLSVLCKLYMSALMVVLPLYTKGTYYQIGDSKYLIFRNASLLCLGIWVMFVVITCLGNGIEFIYSKYRNKNKDKDKDKDKYNNTDRNTDKDTDNNTYNNMEKNTDRNKHKNRDQDKDKQEQRNFGMRWSVVDIFVFLYGACALVSAALSPYEATAWLGYREWYMGAVSQLLFVGIYFFVSREYEGCAYPVYLGEAALFLVVMVAFLQRFGLDVLGLQKLFWETDWEYSHMLSTIGNINWLCGYLSVMIPFPVVGFLYSKRVWKRNSCYAISVLSLALLLTQGSDVGMVLVAAGLGLGFLYGIKRRVFFERSLLLAIGVCVSCPLMGILMQNLGTRAMLPVDGFVSNIILEPVWWVMAVLLTMIYLLERVMSDKVVKPVNQSLVISSLVVAVVVVFIYLFKLPVGTGWGSGRGGLWRAAWHGFCRMNWGQKLIGTGPDCFAEYIYGMPSLAGMIEMEGHWAESIFTNAHNEWLNLLVNGGILGVLAYGGLFMSAFRRYRGMLLGIMVLVLYGVNSIFSFQQVMNAPFLFLVMGICESTYRKYLREQNAKGTSYAQFVDRKASKV